MNGGGSGNESIHCSNRSTARFPLRQYPPANPSHGSVDGQDPTVETRHQVVRKPLLEPIAPTTSGKTFDPMPQLGKRNDAEEHPVLVGVGKPSGDARIGVWLAPFRNDVGIQQEVHRSGVRGGSCLRSTSIPEFFNGDAAKNSARLPDRFVFLSHSAAETMTAATRPYLVIVWGPAFSAWAMTSLNRALASATVHLSEFIADDTPV